MKSFVIYRLPKSPTIACWRGNPSSQWEQNGFVFAPFDKAKPFFFFHKNNSDFYPQIEPSIWQDFLPQVDFCIEKKELVTSDFQQRFEEAQLLFANENLQKIVLSTYKKIPYQKSLTSIFEELLVQFDRALVYLFYHPQIGIWLGATPEILWKNQDNFFYTMALAGTQKKKEAAIFWTEKEYIEHQIVVDLIGEKLQKAHFSFEKTEPENDFYGNLIHLKTHFHGNLKENFVPFEMIDILHPTPAVAGLPIEKSIDFLKEKEPFREFYTGFLGEVAPKNTQIFVNLRCAHLDSKNAYLYGGAGITKESICEKEEAEIALKIQNIEKILS